MVDDIMLVLKKLAKEFTVFSIALDESRDSTDTANLLIFIQGVDVSFKCNEEMLYFS